MRLQLVIGAGIHVRSRIQALCEAKHALEQASPESPERELLSVRVARLEQIVEAESQALEAASPAVEPDAERADYIAAVIRGALRNGGRIA